MSAAFLFAAEMFARPYAAQKDPAAVAGQLIEVRRKYLAESAGSFTLEKPWYRFENTLTVHPFFGYVYNPKAKGVNSFGFRSKYDFGLCGERYCLKNTGVENPLVIGIFGGSFAEAAGRHGDYLEEKLRVLFPGRTPVVINFGVGGHAMPQAYSIFSYFTDLLDAAVFLDGLNELWNSVENNKSGEPPEFAKAVHYKYKLSLMELTPENFRLTNEILRIKRLMLGLTGLSFVPAVERSFLIHYLWQAAHAFAERTTEKKMLQIAESYARGSPFFDAADEELLELAAAKWEKYHRRIHLLGKEEKILTVHLIQPSPYAAGSKRLTEIEEKRLRHSYPILDYVAKGYPKLLSRLPALRQDGAVAEDLIYLYQDLEEAVWKDSAHTNQKGTYLILDRIAEILGEHSAALN